MSVAFPTAALAATPWIIKIVFYFIFIFLPIFGLNALGFRSNDDLIARLRSASWSKLLWQSLQLQSRQNSPLAKQSQYSFKHIDFVQLQGFLLLDALRLFKTNLIKPQKKRILCRFLLRFKETREIGHKWMICCSCFTFYGCQRWRRVNHWRGHSWAWWKRQTMREWSQMWSGANRSLLWATRAIVSASIILSISNRGKSNASRP